MSPKVKKILNIVVDVICGAILIFVLILAISMISSKSKNYDGYTEIFGKAYLAVSSDSMAKDYETEEVAEDNFSKGDMIVVKILKDDKAQSVLQVGDIITFKTNQITENQEKWVLNTHRIVSISSINDGSYVYVTHGDNNPDGSNEIVYSNQVVGVYEGKAGGVGNLMLFMGSSWGFFTFVVVPTLIIVVYAAVNLILVIVKERKVQAAAAAQAREEELSAERERMRAELLAEMGVNPAAQQETAPDGQSAQQENAPQSAQSEEASSETSSAEGSAQADTDNNE